MKKGTIFIGLISILSIVISCKRESCNIYSSQSGIIINVVNTPGCFVDTKNTKQWIIQRQSQFDSLFPGPINSGCFAPTIDFTNHTVLGLYAEGMGCQTAYRREVLKDSTTGNYTYTVRVENCGTCDLQSIAYNFVLVPKISDSAQVAFHVK